MHTGTMFQQTEATNFSITKVPLTFSSAIFYSMACALNLLE